MTAAMMAASPPTQTASAMTSTHWHTTMSLRIDNPPTDDRCRHPSLQLPPGEGRVASLGTKLLGLDDPLSVGVHDRHVRVGPDGQGALGETERTGRLHGQQRDHLVDRQYAVVHHRQSEPPGGFQPHDPEGGIVELPQLFEVPMPASAAAGTPASRNSVATNPSCMPPPSERCRHSQWSTTVRLKARAYSSARRITMPFMTGLPSSDTATHPASFSSPNSASSLPSDPFVIAPMGNTWARPAARALSRMNSVTDWLSFTGDVFGMQQTLVKPPATAAAVPVWIVSLYSNPGSRRCTCRSTNPGRTHLPVASSAVAPGGTASPIPPCAIFPSWIRTSAGPLIRPGSMTRPLWITTVISRPIRGRGPPCGPRRRWSPGRGSQTTRCPPLPGRSPRPG